MLSAFAFSNCDIGTGSAIVSEISDISGISKAVRVSGLYDIVAKVTKESREDMANAAKKIPAIGNITSTLTIIVPEENAVKQMEVA